MTDCYREYYLTIQEALYLDDTVGEEDAKWEESLNRLHDATKACEKEEQNRQNWETFNRIMSELYEMSEELPLNGLKV